MCYNTSSVRFLHALLSLRGKRVVFSLDDRYQSTCCSHTEHMLTLMSLCSITVVGVFAAMSPDSLGVAVSDLETPIGKVPHALIRVSDVRL